VAEVSDAQYRTLLGFRDALRQFLHWSEGEARAAGLTPSQHQLLLAVRGHPGEPTIGEIAEHLALRHHSAVELVDRAAAAGLVERHRDEDDQRVVRLRLCPLGEARIEELSRLHLEELRRLAPLLAALDRPQS